MNKELVWQIFTTHNHQCLLLLHSSINKLYIVHIMYQAGRPSYPHSCSQEYPVMVLGMLTGVLSFLLFLGWGKGGYDWSTGAVVSSSKPSFYSLTLQIQILHPNPALCTACSLILSLSLVFSLSLVLADIGIGSKLCLGRISVSYARHLQAVHGLF